MALRSGKGYLSVAQSDGRSRVEWKTGEPSAPETFLWTENVFGDLNLLSLAAHRHLQAQPIENTIIADSPGPKPDRRDGSCFVWNIVTE